jgi:hypothetical protein
MLYSDWLKILTESHCQNEPNDYLGIRLKEMISISKHQVRGLPDKYQLPNLCGFNEI